MEKIDFGKMGASIYLNPAMFSDTNFVVLKHPLIPVAMKAKFYLPVVVLLFVFSNVFSQDIKTYFEQQQSVPFQKLYLHTDREFYFTGDTLWFAAYLISEGFAQSESLTKIQSCNLYVDLIDSKGEIVKSELFLIQNGLGSGYVSLSDSTDIEGNFLLRAYTDYLKNFGDDAFFTKTIQVSRVKNSFELQKSEGLTLPKSVGVESEGFTRSETFTTKNIDVSFLPEGGFLLAEESNCVAFKAVDQSGKGRDISGKLLDENGKIILTFKSVYKGAGKFYFYPQTGKSYTAKIDSFANLCFELPEIKNTGAKLTLINQDENKIQMVVQGKNNGRNQLFYLVCLHRGEGLFYKEINQKKVNSVLKIDAGQLRVGINRFVLLDNNLNPVSERLVFKEDRNIENIEISLSKESLSTREEVQLQLKADNIIENELAQVSISVVDENYVNATGIHQNIASYLLLDSELNGYIESPANYFISDENISTQNKLDLLMAVNGWSNYVWNNLNIDSIKVEFEPQTGFNFTGRVKRALGNKALTEGNVSLLVKSDSTTQFLDTPLDENGRFEFRNIVFYDSATVFAQARNKNNKNTIQFEMEMPEIVSYEININNINQLNSFSEIPLSVYRQRYINDMRLKDFYPDKNSILIDEVEKTARRNWKDKYSEEGPYGHGDKTVYIEENDDILYRGLNFYDFLFAKGISGASGKILIDGQPSHVDPDDFDYFFLNTVKYIDYFSQNSGRSAIFGFAGVYGVINIVTKEIGDYEFKPDPLLGGIVEKIKGFTPVCEFYSPKYLPENLNSEVPDFRNTLYWNPKVTLENGEFEVSFFSSDNISRYKIYVEGITKSGKICLGEAKFEVDRILKSEK